jgi:hypothetical protein
METPLYGDTALWGHRFMGTPLYGDTALWGLLNTQPVIPFQLVERFCGRNQF